MSVEELDNVVARSVLGRTLQSFGVIFGWSNYSSQHSDHRRFQAPRKAVSSYKLMQFGYDHWRVVFSAKRAAESPGNFGENLLVKEFGPSFARRYLEEAQDTSWLEEVKNMYEQVLEGTKEEPDGQKIFDRAEWQMVFDGYY